MKSVHKEYKIRSGTIDLGKEYESKILTLLCLQCLHYSKEDFWFAFNADGVGAFDDVILRYGDYTYMLQLKHKDNSKTITENEFMAPPKGDLSLKKYFQHILDLKNTLSNNITSNNVINQLGRFENIFFLLYTNRSVNNYNFLTRICDIKKLSWLTSNNDCEIYRFSMPDFLLTSDKFYLFSKQIHAKDLDKRIEDKIKTVISTNNSRIICDNLVKFVTDWGKGNLGGHYFLTRDDIIRKLTELLLIEYEIKLSKEPYGYYNICEQKMIWNNIVTNKTITVVNIKFDDLLIFNFLLDYIGSELEKYCHFESGLKWYHNLKKEAQSLFYKNNVELKSEMLKIVGNHGKITISDIYKCLWNCKKIPLLLEVMKQEQYVHIEKILKLSNYSYNVIILNRGCEDIKICNAKNYFKCLQDLDVSERNSVLDLMVKLQGRYGVRLKNILDASMFPIVKTFDIINIILNNFHIGDELEKIPNYYINKGFMSTLINIKAIKEFHNEIFVIDDFDNHFENLVKQEYIQFIYLNELDLTNLENCYVIINKEPEKELPKILFNKKKTIHHLIYRSTDYLQWKVSYGNINNIKEYQAEFGIHLYNEINFASDVTIVSADPGMGKSMLMDLIAYKIPVTKWVLKINLNNHYDYYENDSSKYEEICALKHLQYFNKPSKSDLSNKIFEKFCESKDVVILLDGFDEISLSYKEEVTNIAKSLLKGGFKIWLTTRPLMKSYLENEFNSFAITLLPFNKYDQKEFLLKYFSGNNNLSINAEDLLNTFTDRLLNMFKSNINDQIPEFTGTPLHIQILAEVFKDEFEACLKNNNIEKFNECFDILDLYDKFIKRKIKILCDKFGSGSKDLHVFYKDYQSLYALKLLFPFHKDNIQTILNNFYAHQKESVQLLQKEGVLTIDENFSINFVHRTFAEYLAARWIVENLYSKNKIINDTIRNLVGERFQPAYKFLFNMLDRFLTKGITPHMFVINGQVNKINEIDNENRDSLTKNDRAGRSILHLIALYIEEFPLLRDIAYSITCNFPDNMKIPTDVFGYNPVDYALASCSLDVANIICTKWKRCKITIYIDLTLRKNYLYCAMNNFKYLFDVLLSYFAYRDVMLMNVYKNTIASSYMSYISYHLYSDHYKMKVSDIIHHENFADSSNLFYEIVFGSVKNIQNIVKSSQTSKDVYDIDGNTPLHYASLHAKLEAIDLLLGNGADINKENSDNATALHFGVNSGNLNVVQKLLLNKANINAKDDEGNTPLHLAVFRKKTNIINLLVDFGADVTILNNDYNTCLHLLITKGFDNQVIKLLHKGTCCNKFNSQRETPLHLSLKAMKLNIAALLISNGANVNLEDSFGDTILHAAFKTNDINIVKEVFQKGAYIDHQTQELLHIAAENKNVELIKLFLQNGGDIDAKDSYGNTILHGAAKEFDLKFMEIILKLGACINVQNRDYETPLHIVVKHSYIPQYNTQFLDNFRSFAPVKLRTESCGRASLLIKNGAEINVRNTAGKTPLHFILQNNLQSIFDIAVNSNCKIDVNLEDANGNTALFYVIESRNIDLVEKILKYNVAVNHQNYDGNTPLHIAVKLNLFAIFKLLYKYGSRTTIKNSKGSTPLHTAVTSMQFNLLCSIMKENTFELGLNETDLTGKSLLHLVIEKYSEDVKDKCYEVISEILKLNADINICDQTGNTVLHLAVEKELADLVKLLFDYQPDIDIYNNNMKTPHLLAYEYGNSEIIDLFQEYCIYQYSIDDRKVY